MLRNPFLYQCRIYRRHSSTFVKFDKYLHLRRAQAEKSILLQVNGPDSARDVQDYLSSSYGPIEALYHYSLPSQVKRIASDKSSMEYHWVIAEFSQKSHLEDALKSCKYQEKAVPFRSSMCWFSQDLTKRSKAKNKANNEQSNIVSERLGIPAPRINFSKSKSLNDQILMLEQSLKISEVGTRVRFLVSNHLENSVSTMFPKGCVIPFGSSVNGIGQQTGDLDLVLVPDKSEFFEDYTTPNTSRLWFQSKMLNDHSSSNARFHQQRVMETLADTLTLFVPGISQVQRILQARVPILRFCNDFSGIQCDLSMTNSSGVYMSELIYIMRCLDSRFPALLFAIKSWASARSITRPNPGRQPTNFMFVLLLIYFLQHKKILPTLDILFNNASKQDKRVTSDGIECTFMRDANNLSKFFTPQNQNSTLAELLFEFFQYYSEFDFATKGVSLFTGTPWTKPDTGALYIQNPLERHLNVARNVSPDEVTRLKSECCSALWKLETSYTEKKSLLLMDLLLTPEISTSKFSGSQRIVMRDLLKD